MCPEDKLQKHDKLAGVRLKSLSEEVLAEYF